MTNYRQVAPRILWGSSLQNALDLGYPLDVVTSWSAKREGSIDVQAPSGVEESWTVGTDYLLKGDARWIPQADLVGSPKQTGWDGAAGWRAFLEWARDKNLLRFCPDGRNLLLNPTLRTDANADGLADLWSKDYSTLSVGSWVKASGGFIDGTQAIVLQNTSVTNDYVGVSQGVSNVLPTEVLVWSVDLAVASGAVNLQPQIHIGFFDSSGTFISSTFANVNPSYTQFVRFSITSAAAPANAASARVFARASALANAATGTLYVTNAMLRRNGVADTTFIDNPYIDSYLLDPRMTRTAISLEPAAAQEPDGTRRVTLLLRNTGSPYDGY